MKPSRFLFIFTPLCLLAAILVAGSPLSPDNDLYFHLKCGEYLCKTKQFIWREIFTYTQAGVWDESAHSWLSNVVFYQVHQWGGEWNLKFLNFILLGFTLYFFTRFVFRKTGSRAATFSLGLLALCLHQRVQILRPLLFGECFWAYFVFHFFDNPLYWKKRNYVVAFLCALLWANLHASVVLLVPLCALWVLAKYLQGRKIRKAVVIGGVLPLLTCATPWGFYLFQYAIKLSKVGKLTGGEEWQSSFPIVWKGTVISNSVAAFFPVGEFLVNYDINGLLIITGLPLLLGLVLTRRARTWGVVCSVLSLYLAVLSSRHIIFLLYPLAYLGVSYFRILQKRKAFLWLSPKNKYWFYPLTSIAIISFFHFPENYYVVPSIEKAVNFIEASHFRGNLFNYHTWGSYLIYRLYPTVRVATDARTLVHQDFFIQIQKLKGLTWQQRLSKLTQTLPGDTDALLFSTQSNPLSEEPLSRDWLLIYENNTASFLLHRQRAANKLSQVQQYYQKLGVPFDSTKGFSAEKAYRANPHWVEANRETVPWGKFTVSLVKFQWATAQKKYYESRRMPVPSAITHLLEETEGKKDGGIRIIAFSPMQLGLVMILGILGLSYCLVPITLLNQLRYRLTYGVHKILRS